jgi:hypothetical protein
MSLKLTESTARDFSRAQKTSPDNQSLSVARARYDNHAVRCRSLAPIR